MEKFATKNTPQLIALATSKSMFPEFAATNGIKLQFHPPQILNWPKEPTTDTEAPLGDPKAYPLTVINLNMDTLRRQNDLTLRGILSGPLRNYLKAHYPAQKETLHQHIMSKTGKEII